MKLIADSGSTKTEWMLTEDAKVIKRCITAGFNPYYFDRKVLQFAIKEDLLGVIGLVDIKEIYFYGAGCSTEENKNTVRKILQPFFVRATIEIGHDLLGAARGLCGHQAGIACIMGTGSNSCLYDGNDIVENIPNTGWLFGDKASGMHLGKSFIDALLNGRCPQELKQQFSQTTGLNFEAVLSKVYQEESPNKFFAQVCYFVKDNIAHPFMETIVRNSFKEFFEDNVCKYNRCIEMPVYCSGSIAVIFKDIMIDEAQKLNLSIYNIIKSPMEGLVTFHQ
jgi:N-acetylglucosamine kinase-like BadF-type ATPase